MDFSIIIPAYNCEKTIVDTVKSICEAKIEDMEIIIVDDGSTDCTHDLCKELEGQYSFVKYYYQKNAGVSAARNCGVAHAAGKYIMFWDSDDLADTEVLRKCMLRALEQKADMLIFGMIFQNEYHGKVIQRDNLKCEKEEWIDQSDFSERLSSLFEINYLSSVSNKIINKKVCEKVRFNPKYRAFEDLLYSLECINQCETIYIMPDLAYIYRIECSMTKASREKSIADFQVYMMGFQKAVINLEQKLGTELPELRSKIELVYDWMLRNKLLASSLREVRSLDADKMKVVLFECNYVPKSQAARFYFSGHFLLLRMYSIISKIKSRVKLNIRYRVTKG